MKIRIFFFFLRQRKAWLSLTATALSRGFQLSVLGRYQNKTTKWLKVLINLFCCCWLFIFIFIFLVCASIIYLTSSVQHTKETKINALEEWLEGLYLLRRMIWLCELFISRELLPLLVSSEDRNNSFSLSLLILGAEVMQFSTFST